VRPRNRHELEVLGCVALFVLVILALVGWTLYEHGYLSTALAVVGVIVVSVGVIHAYRGWVVRRVRANPRRPNKGRSGKDSCDGSKSHILDTVIHPHFRCRGKEARKREGQEANSNQIRWFNA
jgi:hypothetical protein